MATARTGATAWVNLPSSAIGVWDKPGNLVVPEVNNGAWKLAVPIVNTGDISYGRELAVGILVKNAGYDITRWLIAFNGIVDFQGEVIASYFEIVLAPLYLGLTRDIIGFGSVNWTFTPNNEGHLNSVDLAQRVGTFIPGTSRLMFNPSFPFPTGSSGAGND